MQSDLGIIAIVFICFGAVVMTIKLLINGRIWKLLIQNKLVQDNSKLENFSVLENDKLAWLKWGIVITAFSLALIVINIIPVDFSDEVKIGITGLFVGISFIVSYIVSVRIIKNQ